MEFSRFERKHYKNIRLSELCLNVIAKNFDSFYDTGIGNKLPPHQYKKVLHSISVEFDVEKAAQCISDENYWKKRASDHFPSLQDISKHGCSWKQLYMEAHFRRELRQFLSSEQSSDATTKIRCLAARASSYVHHIQIVLPRQQENESAKLYDALGCLSLLSSMNVSFEMRQTTAADTQTVINKQSVGMSLTQALSLARLLRCYPALSHLNLVGCNIGSVTCTILMQGLRYNQTVTHLNLGYNNLGDEGCKKIAQLLRCPGVIMELGLTRNHISATGFHSVANYLKENRSLRQLSLSLNDGGDSGIKQILEATTSQKLISSLDLSANRLSSVALTCLARFLLKPHPNLATLNLSNNNLYVNEGSHNLKEEIEAFTSSLKQTNINEVILENTNITV